MIGAGAIAAAESLTYGTVIHAVGAATEGTETRFGVPGSAIFGQGATASADGAANSSYDSYSSAGGAVLMLNMMLGEVAPGGDGSGLYGLVMMTLLAVFLGGLMIGRTPEYLKQRLQARHMKLISLYILTLPAAVLIGTAVAMALPAERALMLNKGPHGLSEVLYAFTSSAANNGSAFAGFCGNTTLVQRRAGPRDGDRAIHADHRGAGNRRHLRRATAGRRHRGVPCVRTVRRSCSSSPGPHSSSLDWSRRLQPTA